MRMVDYCACYAVLQDATSKVYRKPRATALVRSRRANGASCSTSRSHITCFDMFQLLSWPISKQRFVRPSSMKTWHFRIRVSEANRSLITMQLITKQDWLFAAALPMHHNTWSSSTFPFLGRTQAIMRRPLSLILMVQSTTALAVLVFLMGRPFTIAISMDHHPLPHHLQSGPLLLAVPCTLLVFVLHLLRPGAARCRFRRLQASRQRFRVLPGLLPRRPLALRLLQLPSTAVKEAETTPSLTAKEKLYLPRHWVARSRFSCPQASRQRFLVLLGQLLRRSLVLTLFQLPVVKEAKTKPA